MRTPSISIRLNRPNGSVIQRCTSVSMALKKHGFAFTNDDEIIDNRMRVYQDRRGRFLAGDLIYINGPQAAARDALERVRAELGGECICDGEARMYDEVRGPLLIVGAPQLSPQRL